MFLDMRKSQRFQLLSFKTQKSLSHMQLYKSVSQQTLKERLTQVEYDIIKETLEAKKWNITQAAKALDVCKNTLYTKIKRLKIVG